MNSLLDNFKNVWSNGVKIPPMTEKSVKASHLLQLRDTQITIENRACQDIKFAQPLLSLGDVGVIYPNSITVVQGQKGVHKSRLTENFCAAFLGMNSNDSFIGFKIKPLTRFHTVYVDTERNQNDQFPYAIQRIKELAGFDKTDRPNRLEAVSLIEIERAERFEALTQYLEDVRQKHPDEHVIVVLDVVTDCIGSFNDPRESLKLIDHLNMVINRYNVAFICVIHENPSSFGESKARGHLGTELINKATTVISIGYEKGANGVITDLISVKFLHTRNSKRPEPHYLRYSEEAKGLVLAEPEFVSEQKSLRAEKATLAGLKDWLSENLMGEINKADLLPQLAEQFECTERTIETRLKELTEGDEPFLVRSKVGKEVRYSLRVPF